MNVVVDTDGTRYLLLKRSSDSSLVRDPETNVTKHVENDRLEYLEGESPLETAAKAIPDDIRTLVLATPDARTLGLLIELADREPLGVRELLETSDFCESDLHGRLTLLTAAGVLAETRVGGERGYRVTESMRQTLDTLRSLSPEE
ncbi:hypothetical protein OB919_01130 [Halobacteria archaeon AArc-curdl1]|uniref:HTH domain protein n=1 Tax=Natronosalvus hydrolyticus TaxID=2979988 RepID=A0AAP3E5N8_9EURY|nr:hypothetical protein [Halobacteria archaeon AArc-curdl1]